MQSLRHRQQVQGETYSPTAMCGPLPLFGSVLETYLDKGWANETKNKG